MVDPVRSSRGRAVASGLAMAITLGSIVTAASERPAAAVGTYRPPVDAPVTDVFRPPLTPYGRGNWGIEYGTEPGAEVRAAGDGIVVFAGLVAGSRYVTIAHPDGLRSTVGPLLTVDVAVGARILRGVRMGSAAGLILFTVRRGHQYVDPGEVLVRETERVRLVAGRPPVGPERRGIRPASRIQAPWLGPRAHRYTYSSAR